jgi:hypothetical protein
MSTTVYRYFVFFELLLLKLVQYDETLLLQVLERELEVQVCVD